MPDKSKFDRPLYLDKDFIGPGATILNDIYDFYIKWIFEPDVIQVHTSGSTGAPKHIDLPKEAMAESAKQTIAYFNIEKQHTLLLCLPVNFIAGKMMLVRAMVSEATLLVLNPATNPLTPLIAYNKPVYFAAFTPQQVAAILSDENTGAVFKTISHVIIGGGEIPAMLEKKLAGFPNNIYATYGMTETITHIAVRRIGVADKIYKVFKGIRLGLDDRNCLTIQAPYLGAEPIVTNDIVEFEGPHEFRWLGRVDNVINSGGIKLFPEKIEEKIREFIPRDFVIMSMPDEVLGQKPVLRIEGEAWDETTLSLLHKTLRDVLQKYEVPKTIEFVDVFTRTGTGKIVRRP